MSKVLLLHRTRELPDTAGRFLTRDNGLKELLSQCGQTVIHLTIINNMQYQLNEGHRHVIVLL